MKMINLFKKNNIPDPPYDYEFVEQLDEKDYPKYLSKLYKSLTGEKLNLKHPKSINEKIQWLKLYDNLPIKTQLTDKVAVRGWIKEKIGEEYLKPALQICKTFEEINFEKLPHSFIIKANHGCKWHYKIKNKELFIENKTLVELVRNKFQGWQTQKFCYFAGFEMQYKNIEPQIIIEPILIDSMQEYPIETEVYCFNGNPRIIQKIKYAPTPNCCVYNEFFEPISLKFSKKYARVYFEVDDRLKEAVELSKKLAQEFKLVRVDWLLYNKKNYFNEMTFTPYSGFNTFPKKEAGIYLGRMLNLK